MCFHSHSPGKRCLFLRFCASFGLVPQTIQGRVLKGPHFSYPPLWIAENSHSRQYTVFPQYFKKKIILLPLILLFRHKGLNTTEKSNKIIFSYDNHSISCFCCVFLNQNAIKTLLSNPCVRTFCFEFVVFVNLNLFRI